MTATVNAQEIVNLSNAEKTSVSNFEGNSPSFLCLALLSN